MRKCRRKLCSSSCTLHCPVYFGYWWLLISHTGSVLHGRQHQEVEDSSSIKYIRRYHNVIASKLHPLSSGLSYFMRMLGPAMGYALASFCLRMYISPTLTPIITNNDPRWLGAWWLGWIILGITLFVSSIFLTMFPKELPRAAARRMLKKEKQKKNNKDLKDVPEESELPASFKGAAILTHSIFKGAQF